MKLFPPGREISGKTLLLPGLVLTLTTFPQILLARTWAIQVDGSGDAPTIQAGIDRAVAGDTVLVWPGTYYENVDFLGKDLVLLAKYGPAVTTIDGSRTQESVVKFHQQESRAAVLEGFTIAGGQGTREFGSPRGGGIVVVRSSPTIRRNAIVRNESTMQYGLGGGIAIGTGVVHLPRAAPLIEGNLFEENTVTGNGGALSIEHADVIVRKNVFRRNHCDGDGGAIRAYFVEGSAVFEHNQFVENEAWDHGGALHVVVSPGASVQITIQFNLFAKNIAIGSGIGDTGSGGGVWLSAVPGTFARNTLVANIGLGESAGSGGGLVLRGTPSSLEVARNIFAFNEGSGIACSLDISTEIGPNLFWQNTVGEIGGPGSTCPPEWSAGQIVADPLFCNPATDDYRVASNSPAMTGEEVMGAYPDPGCGPGVPVRKSTWGQLKARYR